jgi:hypothetical protein
MRTGQHREARILEAGMDKRKAKPRVIGRRAVNRAQAIFEEDDMIFQEVHQQNDNGKDAFLGLAWSGTDAGLIVWLQIKGGKKYKFKGKPNRLRDMDFRYNPEFGVTAPVGEEGRHVIPIDCRLRPIWSDSRPIFVLVQDPDDGELYFGNLARMADLAMPDERQVPLYPDLRIKPPDPGQEPEAQDRSELNRFKEAVRAEARHPIPADEITPYEVASFVRYADDTIGPSPQDLKIIRRYMADDAAACAADAADTDAADEL